MMAEKARLFHDDARYASILHASTPAECKELGRQVASFDTEVWKTARYEIVKAGNKAKFEQEPRLMRLLLSTGDTLLAEASPNDRIWGIGMDAQEAARTVPAEWCGQNLLGKILMELRTEFRRV